MTLCIGALAEEANTSQCIVLCFDKKISADEFSSETEHKFHKLSSQLISLFADSSARATELAWIYRDFLRTSALDKQKALDQLRAPITTFNRRLANAYVGRRLGLSYDELLANGRSWFGDDEFLRYLANIENHPLRVQLIIAGFIGEFPVLCELRGDELEWRRNFSLIGTGAYAAEPALHRRAQLPTNPLAVALYNLFEAKRIAETSPFVGEMTTMLVITPADLGSSQIRISVVTPEGLIFLEERFKEYGPKPIDRHLEMPADGLLRAQ